KEVNVVYMEEEEGRPVRRKARLAELLGRMEGCEQAVSVTFGSADPRNLFLRAAARLESHVQLLARVQQAAPTDEPRFDLMTHPDWVEITTAMATALEPFPEARAAVATHLMAVANGAAPPESPAPQAPAAVQ